MDARFTLQCAAKDLKRRMRDPIALLLWVGVPLVIGILIGTISGGDGGARPRGRLLFVDLDDSFASRAVSAAFAQGELGKMFDVETVELAAGRARIHDGDGSALIVVPLGFGDGLMLDQPTRIEVVKNPSRKIIPRIAEETLGLAADAVFYAQRIAGDRLRGSINTIVKGPPAGQKVLPAVFIAGFSIEINNTVERLARYLDPLVIEVVKEAELPGPKEPPTNFALLFFPSMLFLSLMFMAQGLSEDLWREKSLGTLTRASSTPGGLGDWLRGKFLCTAVLIGAVATCGLIYAAARFDLSWTRLPLGLAWITLSGSFLYAIMLLIQVHAKSQRGGNLLTNAILFPLSMLGGAFFPFEAMPEWMSRIGKRTPNGWTLEQFKLILSGHAALPTVALGALALLLATLALLWVIQRRTESAFLRN